MAQMADAGIGFGTGNEPGLPPVSLPSTNMAPPEATPLKLTITPKDKGGNFWDSLPDAENNNAPQVQNEAKGENTNFWDTLPDAPSEKPTPPTLGADIGETLVKNTIPNAVVGRFTWPLDVMNLAKEGEGWVGGKAFNLMHPDSPLTPQEEQSLYAPMIPGTGDIVQGAENAMGIEPYDPKYNSTKFLNTVGQTVLARNPVGAPALSVPQALSVGAGAGGAQLMAPDSALAPLVGGMAATFAHAPIAAGFAKGRNLANNMGFGEKVLSLSPDVSATQGQVNQAAQNILGSATNPQGLLYSLQGKSQFVLGSRPTMAEISPDQGLAQYQDAARTQNPAPFQQRAGEQNTARAQAVQNVRGEGNPQSVGEFFTNHLQNVDAALDRAEKLAIIKSASKGASIGKYGELPLEGATNDTIQNAQAVRKEAETGAWKFLDTYGKSPADRQPVIEAAHNLKHSLNELGGEEHAPIETRLYDKIETDWPKGNVNIETLKTMRTSIGDAQREVKPGTQAYRRLSILKNSVDKAIENTVNGIIQHENQAVEAGRMSPEATLEANALQDVKEWYNKRHAAAAKTGSNPPKNPFNGSAPGRRSSPVSSSHGTKVSEAGGHGNGAGSEGMSPAFGKEQQRQYEAARSVTFKNKTLTDLENSGVVKPDGEIDPVKYDRWYQKNRDRLKFDPKFRDSLKDWRDAQAQVNDMRAEREVQQKALEKSQIAKILKADPDRIADVIGNIFDAKDAAQQLSGLVSKVKASTEAMSGLKAAVGDYIIKRFKVDIEDFIGTGGKPEKSGRIGRQDDFRNFIKNNRNALREIYGSTQGLHDLEAVVADIKRTQAFNERAKIRGQSNTAKDIYQVTKSQKKSILGRLTDHALLVGGGIGTALGHTGAGAWIGGILEKAAPAFQSKGLNTIKAIEEEMLLHPSTFGRAMLEQVEAEKIPLPLQRRIASMLLNSAPQETIASSNYEKDRNK